MLFYLHGLPFNRMEPAIYGGNLQDHSCTDDLYSTSSIRLISVDRSVCCQTVR